MNRPAFLAFSLAFALALPGTSTALDYAITFHPRTGDVYVDTQLGDINAYARADSGRFIDDVVIGFGAPRLFVQELYATRRWAPGDIYYACALAHQLGRPCAEIADIYERDHGQGCGVIAQRLGIKPGSAEFHALKGRVGKGHGGLRGGGHGAAGRPAGSGASPGGKPDRAADAPSGREKGPQGSDNKGGKGRNK
jgi:hypothetical protein